ncbi:MAG TPA: cupin domain-containing protein, partial [Candidatus Sulfotelmatobacter sp.]|nr:cupin domain-containing protein [Candidatus Sulfotelmatobacter sp.]
MSTAPADNPKSELVAVHRAAGQGDALWAMGSLYQVKLRATESARRLTVMEVLAPPGSASPLHVHHRESEAFYLLDGTMTCMVGDDLFRLGPGSFIHLP